MIKTIKYFVFLSLISICIVLGFWQIDRGNEKKDIYNSFTENLSKNPTDFSLLDKKPNQFTNTIIKKSSYSYLSDKQFLLDNKVNNRQAGYEVITPVLVNKEILLVNRGWITNHSRVKLPSINIVDGDHDLIGYTYYYSDPYELQEEVYSNEFPVIIQNIKINEISDILQKGVLPYVLILSKKQNNSYTIQTNYKDNPELKHYMYAGQWFLFSIIGIIFMIILMRKEQ